MLKGQLNIVGIGPGSHQHITPAAIEAIKRSTHIVGYTTYLKLIKEYLPGKIITRTGMSEEIGRAQNAINLAKEGKEVALISSGDAGAYGMAGLAFEVLKKIGWKKEDSPKINLIPGITAANSCASLVGAPLVHDSCTISLSDLLTPWPVIEKRIESAAQGDFVISFYNPASGRRQRQIVEAQRIIKKYRSGQTPVGLVKSGYRKRQNVVISDLDHFLDYEIGMLTTVIVGSSQTEIFEGQMFTPRGYKNKYDIESGEIRPGQRKTFSLRCEGDMNSRLKDLSSDDGETIKLAKTYTTPTDSWVTPKDKKSKDFLNEEKPEINLSKKSEDPIQGALNALEILKRKNFYQSTSKEPSKNRREENLKDLSFFKEEKDYCKIGRLGGALLVNIREKYFLVGEFKEPCLLNDHGFKEIEQKNETHVYNIELLDKIKNPEIEYSFISAELKENLLLDLSLKWIIKRNGSVSERLTGLIKDHSSSVIYKKKKYIDITWLAQMPTSVWGIVRENILKC